MRDQPPGRPGLAHSRSLIVALMLGAAVARSSGAEPTGPDRLVRPGAPAVEGRLRLDPTSGLRFEPTAGGMTPAGPGAVVEFTPSPARGPAVPPMFRAAMGESGRVSGTLTEIDEGSVSLSVPWQSAPVVARRPGIQSLTQRRGEVRVLDDRFDALDPAWDVAGGPRVVVEDGESALLLPAAGSSIERRFDPPIEAGRVELSFRDDGRVHPGRSWSLALTFRAAGRPAVARVLLGWAEESLAVESPDGPSLAVQRLARGDGWRRATVRFDARRTEIAIDGQALAHGRGPEGPLESIRIAVEGAGDGGPDGLVAATQVVRFASVPSDPEVDPAQDEARLAVGDQLFGAILRGDRDRVEMTVDGRPAAIAWKDLAGLHFRRDPAAGDPIAGALARVEWEPGDGRDREPDFAEGAVTSLTDDALTLQTSYAGTLTIPRDRLARLTVLEPGVRLVIDPCSHHLGDEISGPSSVPPLDPPMYEGGVLERAFEVPADAPAVGPASIVLDVVGVVGEATGLMFSDMVRRGELKTYVVLDGKRIDYINRHIEDANESTRRIRVPVPADALGPGRHVLRLEQTGDARDPNAFDDLGVLALAVEFNPPAPRP
ncbi:hypothetical protein [Paludisphaera sp.]|uniref:hypothetical protein n=1 Tax=Paludisphaera sp. TaxID=2017432 RepID=UPI00301E5810